MAGNSDHDNPEPAPEPRRKFKHRKRRAVEPYNIKDGFMIGVAQAAEALGVCEETFRRRLRRAKEYDGTGEQELAEKTMPSFSYWKQHDVRIANHETRPQMIGKVKGKWTCSNIDFCRSHSLGAWRDNPDAHLD